MFCRTSDAAFAELLDAHEDGEYRKGNLGRDLPKELRRRQDRVEAISRARKGMEAEAAATAARDRAKQAAAAEAAMAEAAANATDADAAADPSEQQRLADKAARAREKAEAARPGQSRKWHPHCHNPAEPPLRGMLRLHQS